MSIQVMSWVWENAPIKGRTLLVLLAIADWASDEGIAWPSVDSISKKARCSIRTAQTAIEQLVKAGLLSIESNAGPHGTNRYCVVQKLRGAEIAGVRKTTGGVQKLPEGVQKRDAKLHPIRKEPSLEPSIEPSTRLLQPFQELRGFTESNPKQLITLVGKINSNYASVDLEEEALKMSAWLEGPKGKGRKCSPGFILAWLGRDAKERRNGQHPSRDVSKYAEWPDGRAR